MGRCDSLEGFSLAVCGGRREEDRYGIPLGLCFICRWYDIHASATGMRHRTVVVVFLAEGAGGDYLHLYSSTV